MRLIERPNELVPRSLQTSTLNFENVRVSYFDFDPWENSAELTSGHFAREDDWFQGIGLTEAEQIRNEIPIPRFRRVKRGKGKRGTRGRDGSSAAD